MNNFAVLLFICCTISTLAHPGIHGGGGGGGGGNIQLHGVPDAIQFSHLEYPQFNILDLGSSSHGSVPPTIVHINTKEKVEIPKPYPVKIPHPYPVPVPVSKPYPVVQTKLVHVPVPHPVEIIKKVPVPIEVPKPVFIPSGGLKHLDGSEENYGSSFGGSTGYDQQQLSQNDGGNGYAEGFEGALGHQHSQADQSAGYQSVSQPEEGWVPSDSGDSQQQEQH